jgi:Protein of unknown function (DUF1592)/Protein of unknown function (DUF1588)/Protein of unknown function (DUF1595)/Protein of unknown function (DUF1587)/Protein of unknown function (DUF1585)
MRGRTSWMLLRAGAVLAFAIAGCTGDIGGNPTGDVTIPEGPSPEELCANVGPTPGPHPRLVRLTHIQYDNTVRDLFGLDIQPSSTFIEDPAFDGFTNNAKALLVSGGLARDYRRAAEEVGALVMADPAAVARIVPCAPEGDGVACAREFIESFGRKVYRRALPATTVDAYAALFARGSGLYEAGTPFDQGVQHVVEAMLQSPNFLYRVELSEALDGDNLIPLDDFEIATRLSYLLWNSQPDEDLLAAAESGALQTPEGIEAQARRLIADPKATGAIDDFHEQWLHMRRYESNIAKDPALYPEFQSSDISNSLKLETQRFIRHVILELEGDYEALLSEPVTFVDDKLAAIYELEGTFTSEMQRVDLDPDERAGLLTQIGFLSSHAYPDGSSPIHRGVFVQRQLLCATLPDPPGDVDFTLPPLEGDIKTTRQQVEAKTSPEVCANCHDIINPPGFAFEHFDAIGRFRADEAGEPIDAAASITVGEAQMSFDGAVDISRRLAVDPVAQRCYLTQWFRYGYAREDDAFDQCTIGELDKVLQEKGYNIKELLVALTLTKTFRFRAVEEVGQ